MNIYVNDIKIEYKPIFPLTWSTFFKRLLQNSSYILKDHGIVNVAVDGVESMNVMMENVDQMIPEGVMEVRIMTKDSISITHDGIAKVLTLIENIKKEISSAADNFREGNIKEASGKIARIMEALKPMINFINSVGMSFSLDFDHIMFNSTMSLREKVDTFLKTFEDLILAQSKRDYVEVADYLEYQLIEDMSDWTLLVNILMKEIEASTGNHA